MANQRPLVVGSFIVCNHFVEVIPSFFLKAALKANRDLKPQRSAIASTVKYRSFFTNNSFLVHPTFRVIVVN